MEGRDASSLTDSLVLPFPYTAAHAYSPETAAAFLEELSLSNPTMLKMVSGNVLGALPKAYRVRASSHCHSAPRVVSLSLR